jgi:digeranylgeranylglycerophospholipid reductase
MRNSSCDILIVGAGPAGSSAARTAAAREACVVVVERRAVVGVPVRCAEYIPAPLLGEADVGRHFVVQPIRGMRTFLNGGLIQESRAPGYTIRRDLFDQALAEAASKAGAEILLGTDALFHEGGEVLIRQGGEAVSKIRATVIIGADGPHSRVGKWIGSTNRNLIPAVQVKVPLVHPLEFTEVFFDDRIYGGYGWLFPKGDEANVGLGMKDHVSVPGKMRAVLEGFLALLLDQGKIREDPYGLTAGWIPAEEPRTIVRGNVLLAGDAAGHTHPITGAGVLQAVLGGQLAGTWAAQAVETGDMRLLAEYEHEWQDLFGETLQRGCDRRRLLEQEWGRLNEIIKHCWVTFKEYYDTPDGSSGTGTSAIMA